MTVEDDEKTRLEIAVQKATEGTDVKYIICNDMLGFEKHEKAFKNNKYVIQKFGHHYVALIF